MNNEAMTGVQPKRGAWAFASSIQPQDFSDQGRRAGEELEHIASKICSCLVFLLRRSSVARKKKCIRDRGLTHCDTQIEEEETMQRA